MAHSLTMAQFDEEQYYSCEFWNERYKKLAETKGFHHYDWLLTWKDLKTFLKAYLDKKMNILMIGAGTSRMSYDMHEEGYLQITNIDFAESVVQMMKDKYPAINYHHLDARQMDVFGDNEFALVIDKGTLDCVLCNEDAEVQAKNMMEEVRRVLAENGLYILISHGRPSYRLSFLKPFLEANIRVDCIEKCFGCQDSPTDTDFHIDAWIYVCLNNLTGALMQQPARTSTSARSRSPSRSHAER